jgi:hypothetical protein
MLRQLAHNIANYCKLVFSTGVPATTDSEGDRIALRSTLHPATLLSQWWPSGYEEEIEALRAASGSVFAVMMQAGQVQQARAILHQARHMLREDIEACLAEYARRIEKQEFKAGDSTMFLDEIRDWLLSLPLELFPELPNESLTLLGIAPEVAEGRLTPYHNLLDSVGGYEPDARPLWV